MTFDEIMTARGQRVCKSNSLIRSQGTPRGSYENKVLEFLISKIMPYDAPDTVYSFSVREFCEVARITKNSGKIYGAIKAAFSNLASENMWFDREDGESVLVTWFRIVKANKRLTTFSVIFHEELAPHLFALRGKYTSYTLDNVLMLTGRQHYSAALYELIRSYYNDPINDAPIFTEAYLRKKLRLTADDSDIPNYEGFSHLCMWAIIPALNDIRENTYLSFDYKIDEERKCITISNIKESSNNLLHVELLKTGKYVRDQEAQKQKAKQLI